MGRVKSDYLIELARYWYRIDTNSAGKFRPAPRPAPQSIVRSPAYREASVSRGRTSIARSPSTITSQGRGREL